MKRPRFTHDQIYSFTTMDTTNPQTNTRSNSATTNTEFYLA
jgi:hypothetical protein